MNASGAMLCRGDTITGQRLVLDVDEFDSVRGRRHGFGNDDDDGFADETHDIAREQRPSRRRR